MLQHQPQEEPTLDAKVVAQLTSKKEQQRIEAEAQIASLGPEAVDALLALVQQEAVKRKKKRRKFLIGLTVYFVCIIGLTVFLSLAKGHLETSLFNSIGSMSGLIAAAFAVSQAQRNATRKLAQFEDIRTVGPLAEALEFNDKSMRAVTEEALIKLLPRLRASDAPLLNEDQRACLNRALTRSKNTPLVLAILKAYEQVGDEKALPCVEKLAEGEGRTGKEERVQAAAIGCLPALRTRIEQQRASQTLLRASDAVATPPEVLLRPAQAGGSDAPPEQLLRASTQEE
jgi:hypothetical protein